MCTDISCPTNWMFGGITSSLSLALDSNWCEPNTGRFVNFLFSFTTISGR